MKKKTKTLTKLKNQNVYKIKISLLGTDPLVWRTVLVHDFIELSELHMLIQMSMGWDAKHLYEFKINNVSYLDEEGLDGGIHSKTEGVLLSEVLGSTKKFTYIYDFGDGWQHDVEILRALKHDPKINYPVCIDGENACPPEDCGGIHGFDELKRAISGPDSEEKDEKLSWLGGFYNPQTFDPNFVNKYFLWADLDEDLIF